MPSLVGGRDPSTFVEASAADDISAHQVSHKELGHEVDATPEDALGRERHGDVPVVLSGLFAKITSGPILSPVN